MDHICSKSIEPCDGTARGNCIDGYLTIENVNSATVGAVKHSSDEDTEVSLIHTEGSYCVECGLMVCVAGWNRVLLCWLPWLWVFVWFALCYRRLCDVDLFCCCCRFGCGCDCCCRIVEFC